MSDPVLGVDFEARTFRYFSTPSVTVVSCLRCLYATGKRSTATAATKAFMDHWNAKHGYERCTGCGKEYLYPHLCREHILCGFCHPSIEGERTNRD